MPAATMTEAEQERAARAKIDRLNEIRREYAERKGITPAVVQLTPADFERAEREAGEPVAARPEYRPRGDSMSGRVIEAAKRLADASGVVDRAKLHEALGASDSAARQKINGLVYALRSGGKFPFTLVGGTKSGPKPKADLGPLSALKARINGTPQPPSPPAVGPLRQPEPAAKTPENIHETIQADPARLAELAADWCRRIDDLADDERAFLLAFVRHRYG